MLRACQTCGAATPRTRCPQCERAWQAKRNARPERHIYGGDWPAESRRIRAEQPWCSACGSESSLTVDHPSRAVLCRPCHAKLENARRRGARETGEPAGAIPGPTTQRLSTGLAVRTGPHDGR